MVKHHKKSAFKSLLKKAGRLGRSRRFGLLYLVGSLATLFITTLFWSITGAFIQASNADQLANSFLLGSHASASGALLPSQHTFLLKVPLFWLIGLFGFEPSIFIAATVVLALITVFGLVFILSRFEGRPLILGTIILTLAAVLLYLPAQSYPGSLLPLNYAMLTTRNIEYVLFIGALILVVRSRRIVSGAFLTACLAFALLLASDRLFVSLGAGTAIIGVVVFLVTKRRDLVRTALRLLCAVAIGYVGSVIVIALLGMTGVHFDSGSAVGPYGFVQGPKQFGIALVYAVLGVFTNLGANPAYDGVVIKELPTHFVGGLFSPAGPGYIFTIVTAVILVWSCVLVVKRGLERPVKKAGRRRKTVEWQQIVPLLLIATSLTAFGVYVVSNHYYPADARYLAIVLPAAFISLAAVTRFTKRVAPERIILYGAAAVFAVLFGVIFQIQNSVTQNRALSDIATRNQTVATALKSHTVGTLLGNYWRVLPIRLGSPTLTVTPLEGCTIPRQVLSSTAWQPELHTTSFAYILRLDGGLAGFPACSLKEVTEKYGRPDSSVIIAGTRANPKEILLFYDEGVHFLKTAAPSTILTDTVKPISIDTAPFTTCPSKTIMQFIAHEDDDLLFMNPDLARDIKAGNCIRTVYFTAGDAGSDKLYWLGRQKGAEEAYNEILRTPGAPWTERIVSVDGAHTVTIANPRGNHKISLIFLHLPDGNPEGTGFASEHYESLRKLYARTIPVMHPVDDSHESYTADELTGALAHMMAVYKPAEVRSQSTFSGTTIRDHSDHNAVGEFATRAFASYQKTDESAAITYYMGYPIHTLPPNVSGEDYDEKAAAFLTFGHFDGATCHTLAECNANAVYGLYLARQYTYPY